MSGDERKDQRGAPDAQQAPVDGPSPGDAGNEDEGELGSASQDKPGSAKTSER